MQAVSGTGDKLANELLPSTEIDTRIETQVLHCYKYLKTFQIYCVEKMQSLESDQKAIEIFEKQNRKINRKTLRILEKERKQIAKKIHRIQATVIEPELLFAAVAQFENLNGLTFSDSEKLEYLQKAVNYIKLKRDAIKKIKKLKLIKSKVKILIFFLCSTLFISSFGAGVYFAIIAAAQNPTGIFSLITIFSVIGLSLAVIVFLLYKGCILTFLKDHSAVQKKALEAYIAKGDELKEYYDYAMQKTKQDYNQELLKMQLELENNTLFDTLTAKCSQSKSLTEYCQEAEKVLLTWQNAKRSFKELENPELKANIYDLPKFLKSLDSLEKQNAALIALSRQWQFGKTFAVALRDANLGACAVYEYTEIENEYERQKQRIKNCTQFSAKVTREMQAANTQNFEKEKLYLKKCQNYDARQPKPYRECVDNAQYWMLRDYPEAAIHLLTLLSTPHPNAEDMPLILRGPDGANNLDVYNALLFPGRIALFVKCCEKYPNKENNPFFNYFIAKEINNMSLFFVQDLLTKEETEIMKAVSCIMDNVPKNSHTTSANKNMGGVQLDSVGAVREHSENVAQ